jgi:AraC-like DNA-binding protein
MSESTNEAYRSLVFFIDDKLLKDFVSQNLELFDKQKEEVDIPTLLLTLKSNETFGKYVESILPYFKNKTIYLEQFLKLKMQELLLHLLEFDKNNHLKKLLFSIFIGQKASIEEVVQNFYQKPLTLSEFAKLSGRSLSSFKREFSQIYGIAPGQWIKNKKLEHAAFLLKNKTPMAAIRSIKTMTRCCAAPGQPCAPKPLPMARPAPSWNAPMAVRLSI